MIAASLPLPLAAAGPTPLAMQWGETWLYLRNSMDLSTAPPGPAEIPTTNLQADTPRTWTMPDGMKKALCVEGGEPGSNPSGFDLVMNLTNVLPSQNDWTITVSLMDEDTAIARETRTVTGPNYGIQSLWHLDYTSNRTSCQVLKGHRLAVEVVSSRIAAPAGLGWHLVFWAEDALAPTVSTENAAGPSDLFYPNDLDGSRAVIVKGVLNNAFAASLVTAVRVGIEGPGGGTVVNGTAAVQDDNFTYTWSYARGLSAGPYNIRSEVEDRQGNIFVATTSITMASYGLKITTPGQVNQTVTGYTVPGDPARYDLTVTNIGGQPTTVLMVTENPPVSGWSVSFSSDSFGLAAGASNLTIFRATPSGSIQPGNSAQATVVAQARDDPALVKARGTMLTTTIVIREAALGIDPEATDATIRLGGSVEYDFTLTNNGGLATDVTLEVTAAPEGWTRSVSGTGVVTDGAGWKVIALGPGASVKLTLNVTAPAESTSTDEYGCVVTARAVGNASASATFTATTQLLLGIELAQASPTGTPQVAPGARVEFQVDVVNTDPLQAHTITQAGTTVIAGPNNPAPVAGAGAPIVEVFAPADGSCCQPHSSATISVIITMPAKAATGAYTFELSTIVDGVSSQVATLNLTVNIVRQTRISLTTLDVNSPLAVGTTPVSFDLEVANEGNEVVTVDLEFGVTGTRNNEAWKVTFLGQDGVELTNNRVRVDPYTSQIVTVMVEAPTTSFHGDERTITVRGDVVTGGASDDIDPAVGVVVQLEPMDRFVRLLSAQYIILFVVGFILWGFITASWGRTIWRRTHGGGKAPPDAPQP